MKPLYRTDRTTRRFYATTLRVYEREVDICTDIAMYGDLPVEEWLGVMYLDAGVVTYLKPRTRTRLEEACNAAY